MKELSTVNCVQTVQIIMNFGLATSTTHGKKIYSINIPLKQNILFTLTRLKEKKKNSYARLISFKKYKISRLEQDEFACSSQIKAEYAQKNNRFIDEIVPVEISKKEGSILFKEDEFIRHGSNIESLSKLRPAFDKEGSVTAGNSSGVNDGAAAFLLMEKNMAEKLSLSPMAKIVSYAHAGVDPSIMGIGPVLAVKKALSKAKWDIKDLDLIEANEAFAAQAISVNKELGWDTKIINVNGGAIALGHPIGASGARILVTLVHEMQKRGAKKALATLCIGGGMGVAVCVELI